MDNADENILQTSKEHKVIDFECRGGCRKSQDHGNLKPYAKSDRKSLAHAKLPREWTTRGGERRCGVANHVGLRRASGALGGKGLAERSEAKG